MGCVLKMWLILHVDWKLQPSQIPGSILDQGSTNQNRSVHEIGLDQQNFWESWTQSDRGSLSLITIKSSFSKIFSLISAIKSYKSLLEFHSTRRKSNIVPFSMFRIGARTISVIFRILDTSYFIQGSTDRQFLFWSWFGPGPTGFGPKIPDFVICFNKRP